MYSIIFHPDADTEFVESVDWYEVQSEGLGRRFFLSVSSAIKIIQTRPETFGYSRKPFREASVAFFPYIIVFKINKKSKLVYVLAVYHTSRNPKLKYRK
jgi:hypothetical protein